jgi:hypothetical protein
MISEDLFDLVDQRVPPKLDRERLFSLQSGLIKLLLLVLLRMIWLFDFMLLLLLLMMMGVEGIKRRMEMVIKIMGR